ncbi:unnamed protein product [Hymenolepis diminuta]|uniref:Dynein light chain n=1 Tax=Hymenolepis diminuta TaxID=6216 RepID=A0A564ZA92_HYMDI|nr:unnamed protein product [Hymenolepis diminuta]
MHSVRDSNAGQISKANLFNFLLNFRPAILKNVQLLESDMSVMKRESIILLVLEVVLERRSKKETLDEIKQRLQAIYGEGWSVYIAEGRYWSVCSHNPGSNLAFLYQNTVYGVYQTPHAK